MVEDRPGSTGGERSFSWWDVQDSNAKLPVKETSQYELRKLLFPSKPPATATDSATKAAKGAFKMMGKAVASAVVGDDGAAESSGPPVSVLAFKLLDLVKIHDDFAKKHPVPPPASGPRATSSSRQNHSARAAVPQQPARQQQQYHHQAQRQQQPRPPATQQQPQQQQRQQQHRPPQQQSRPPQQPEASLMDFGDTSQQAAGRKAYQHSASSPASFDNIFGGPSAAASAPPGNETRAEKLKREYEEKAQTANRVWDAVDERWVEVDPKVANSAAAALRTNTTSAPPGAVAHEIPKKKEVGITLDPANAIGKSAEVQAAVHQRVNEMRESQEKALQEVREREEKKKKDEEEEDVVRKQLEPKIKVWSEEHGKKKQLRALLASLHTILWPGAKWKPISIGDILDDGKVKRFFHKATLVVHPDKTHHLPPDQRFLAKRIFDALCQAKTEFDSGAK